MKGRSKLPSAFRKIRKIQNLQFSIQRREGGNSFGDLENFSRELLRSNTKSGFNIKTTLTENITESTASIMFPIDS